MAIDFPNSPTSGQVFIAANGTSWQWNGTAWVAAGLSPAVITGAPNKLINPFMEIDQPHEGALVSAYGYVIDGWIYNTSTGALSAQRVTDAPTGYPNSIRLTVTTAAAVVAATTASIYQPIEADELVDTAFGTPNAQSLALAFWVKSSVAGTYSGNIRNAATNRSYVFNFTISSANTWTFIIQVIPGDTSGTWVTSGNAVGMYVSISFAVGSTYQTTPNAWVSGNFLGTSSTSTTWLNTNGATFQLGPCGLWVAAAAQPLLRTNFQQELARCQRYYEKSYSPGIALGTASNYLGAGALTTPVPATINWQQPITFKTTKRAVPTMTAYSPTTGAAGVLANYATGDVTATVANIGMNGLHMLALSLASTAGNVLYVHWVADARL
jgi:hypothetical protein